MTLTTYTTTFTQQNGTTNELIDVIIEYGADFTGDGLNDIKITLKLDPASNSGTEDMIGVAFDIQNDAVSGLQIIDITKLEPTAGLSTYTPTSVIGANQVSDNNGFLDPGFNTSGGDTQEPYDVGVKFSDEGSGEGIVQEASFVIKGNTNLDAEALLENTDWWIRLQSTNNNTGSAKTGGHIGDLPTPGSFTPAIAINKVTNGADGLTILAGSPVTWTYTVTNTGNVGLSNVSLSDDQLGTVSNLVSGDTNHNNILDTNETWVYQASGTAVAGNYNNVGTVTGSYNGTSVNDTDPSNYFGANPSLTIDKVTGNGTTNGDGLTILAGSAITWTYNVSNTGNVGISNVSLSDNKLGSVSNLVSGDANNNNILDVGETWKYTATGIAGTANYSNIGTVTGSFTDDLGNSKNLNATDPSNYIAANPSLTIDKVTGNGTTNGDGLTILAGSAITWTYNVSNTGNVGISNVSLSDNKLGSVSNLVSGDANNNNILDVGETWKYTATGIAGTANYSNIGTVTGSFTDDLGNSKNLNATDPSNYIAANPSLTIDKVTGNGTTNGDGLTILAGSAITWTYNVSNTGNVGISNVSLSDNKLGSVSNLVSGDANNNNILDVGETWKYTATGIAGTANYSNIGTVTGSFTDDLGNSKNLNATDPSNYIAANPSLTIDKVTGNGTTNGDGLTILAGSAITWTYNVSNTGNVGISNVSLSDNKLGSVSNLVSGDANNNNILDVGETWKYTATGTAQAGNYQNTGTVTGSFTDDLGNSKNLNAADPSNYFGAAPAIDVEKYVSVDGGKTWLDADTATGPLAADPQYGGTNPQFKFVVQNTGNVALSNITLSDDKFDLNGAAAGTSITINSLAANDGAAGGADEYSFTFTGAAWQAGQHTDIATVSAAYTDGLNNTKTVTDSDAANYYGVSGPGTGTPGFWKQWTAVWDGNTSNDNTFNTKANFAKADILYKVTDPVTGTNTQTGILVGDFNKNGITDGSEKTIFYTVAEAQAILNASTTTENQDARYILDKQLISSWLNVLAGNEFTQIQTDITNGVQWLQNHTPNEGGTSAGDGSLTLNATANRVASSSEAWNGILSNTAPLYQKGSGYGVQIKNVLDYYNNTGAGFAIDRDTGLVGGDLTTLNTLHAYQQFF